MTRREESLGTRRVFICMVATVALSCSLYDRMKTRLDIELRTTAFALATIDVIATTVERLLQLQVFNLLNAADLSEKIAPTFLFFRIVYSQIRLKSPC